MKQNFQRSLAFVLKHAGGFVDHPLRSWREKRS